MRKVKLTRKQKRELQLFCKQTNSNFDALFAMFHTSYKEMFRDRSKAYSWLMRWSAFGYVNSLLLSLEKNEANKEISRQELFKVLIGEQKLLSKSIVIKYYYR